MVTVNAVPTTVPSLMAELSLSAFVHPVRNRSEVHEYQWVFHCDKLNQILTNSHETLIIPIAAWNTSVSVSTSSGTNICTCVGSAAAERFVQCTNEDVSVHDICERYQSFPA